MKRRDVRVSPGRGRRWLLAALVAAAAGGSVATASAQSIGAAAAEAGMPAVSDVLRLAGYCNALTATPWPNSAAARRALLQRLEALRQPCMSHAAFLAVLGALWLEEGEPAQALLWLERSLLLDPAVLGTQADHALALAALGELAARDALAREWRERTDIPPALRQRLALGPEPINGRPKTNGTVPPPSAIRPPDGWVSYREASLVGGYESNLDHSPRLDEITITPRDAPPRTEPLLTPLRPRRGPALIGDVAWQLARSPIVGSVFQTGIQGSVRHAPGNTSTDWHHLQWAVVASQRWGPWRAQVHGNATWVGGALNEPYRLARLGMSIDREAIGCSNRLTVEGEMRRQRTTRSADGKTSVLGWNSLCPLVGSDWAVGFAGRIGIDRADDALRPGGDQRHASVGLRILGAVGAGVRLDATLRTTRVLDSEGYNQLLENNATRRLQQTQLTLELSKPLQLRWLYGAEALLQFQAVRQTSNLVIFDYEGLATYGGLRWRW